MTSNTTRSTLLSTSTMPYTIAFLCAIIVLGLSLNVPIIVVLCKNYHSMQLNLRQRCLLLINLALCNSLILIWVLPFTIMILLCRLQDTCTTFWSDKKNQILCTASAFVFNVSYMCGFVTHTLLAVDRLITTIHPANNLLKKMGYTSNVVLVLLAWLVTLLHWIFPLFYNPLHIRFTFDENLILCHFNYGEVCFYSYYTFALTQFFLTPLVPFCYIIISVDIRHLHNSFQKLRDLHALSRLDDRSYERNIRELDAEFLDRARSPSPVVQHLHGDNHDLGPHDKSRSISVSGKGQSKVADVSLMSESVIELLKSRYVSDSIQPKHPTKEDELAPLPEESPRTSRPMLKSEEDITKRLIAGTSPVADSVPKKDPSRNSMPSCSSTLGSLPSHRSCITFNRVWPLAQRSESDSSSTRESAALPVNKPTTLLIHAASLTLHRGLLLVCLLFITTFPFAFVTQCLHNGTVLFPVQYKFFAVLILYTTCIWYPVVHFYSNNIFKQYLLSTFRKTRCACAE